MSKYIRIEWADSQEWLEKVDDEKIFAGQDNDVFVREDLFNRETKTIYRVEIQDGERSYTEYSRFKPEDDFVDGFETEVKDIEEYEATEEEIKVLQKFGVI